LWQGEASPQTAMFAVCKPKRICRRVSTGGVGFEDVDPIAYPAANEGSQSPVAETSHEEPTSPGGCRLPFASCAWQRANSDDLTLDTSSPPVPSSSSAYIRMEDSDSDSDAPEKFVRRLASIQKTVHNLRKLVSVIMGVAGMLSAVVLALLYNNLPAEEQLKAREYALLGSIPVVALLFTWFHIWLAIQMMFRPIEFVGLWQCGSSGTGVGWQGVVPRKAHKMAKTSYNCARPHLEGPKEWLGRVNARNLVAKIRPQLAAVIEGALSHVGTTHFPKTQSRLPESVRSRITEAAVDKVQETSPVLWKHLTNLLCDSKIGIDNDGMIVKVFTENKELLNQFFLSLGETEFRFIEHCGAFMGFICGLVQLIAFNNLSDQGRQIFLPVTGFFLGIVTNWLAITMVFHPSNPIHIKLCGWHIYSIQGLFLKRQQDVAVLYSKMLCDNFLSFSKVVDYLQTQHVLWEKLKHAYVAHNTRVLRQTLGMAATWLAPLALGKEQFEVLENDLKLALVNGLYEAKDIHRIAGRYIGKVTEIEDKNCKALQNMRPDEFENLLHPVFKEDEWILVLLGGILGAIVGMAQVFFLSK